jgi:acetyl/propionyl-CoA carboxylase alpha subunit
VYSDADADAAHVQAADDAVRLGAAPAGESYLRADRIIEAALATGAEAIHPGYGFLSERASFARAVVEAGLVFIGPPADAIDALGDKLAARRTAAAADVPVVPGTFDPAPIDRADAIDEIAAAADAIGFPLLVKAAAGGGGRGMRRVASVSDLPSALVAASNEARAAFGDGAVYLEREVRPARHIEVQLLGDGSGDVIALGERDCSVQRRHQKLVEETPAPGLTTHERRELHGMAVRAARAAGLSNASTAEFLFDRDRRFWFLEVNARLQVEHGVTELVTDLDSSPSNSGSRRDDRCRIAHERQPKGPSRRQARDRSPSRRRGPFTRLRTSAGSGGEVGDAVRARGPRRHRDPPGERVPPNTIR